MSEWVERSRPCKLGTMPAVVHTRPNAKIEVGRWVSVQECENGKWSKVFVTRVDPDGYFVASR